MTPSTACPPRPRRLYWENIGLVGLLYSLLLSLAAPVDLTYLKASRLCRLAMKFVKRMRPGLRISEATFRLGHTDAHGRSLRYQVEVITTRTVDSFFNRVSHGPEWVPVGLEEHTDLWARGLKAFCIARTRDHAAFLTALRHHLDQDKTKKQTELTVFMEDFVTAKELLRNCPPPVSPWRIRRWPALRFSILFAPIPGIVALLAANALTARFRPKPTISLPDKDKPRHTILEQYQRNIFDRYPHSGHLFWFPPSGLKPEQVVLFCDRKDSPCAPEAKKAIESHNMGWADVPLRKLLDLPPEPGKSFLKVLRRVRIPRPWSVSSIWRWSFSVFHLYQVECYRTLISSTRCRAVHQHREFSSRTLALALALRQEDGIFIWNHWSIDHFPAASYNAGTASLIFSWGDHNDGYFTSHDFHFDHMLQTGMVCGDNLSQGDKAQAKALRAIFSSKVTFIITLFDSSYGQLDQHAPEAVLHFYECALDYASRTPEVGLIIKSKGTSYDCISFTPTTLKQIDALKEEGRLCIPDGYKTPPIVAARASNACLSFSINSAGIIAGFEGTPSLHWDIPGNTLHPLYDLGGEGTVIFKDFKAVENALNAIRKGDTTVGDFSTWRSYFDAFTDDQGANRAGKVIQDFFKALDTGMNSRQALAHAVEIYAHAWGAEHVSSPVSSLAHRGNTAWREVMKRSNSTIHTTKG